MKSVRMEISPISFIILGIFFLIMGVFSIIKLEIGGSLESLAWVMIGAVFSCVVFQILLHFLPECFCNASSEDSE